MMSFDSALDLLSWGCILGGAFFSVVGAIGILRLPDVYSRMHAAGMIDTFGIGLILVGLMFQATAWIIVMKLGLILAFVFFTSPTATYALARAALDGGVDPGPHDALPSNDKLPVDKPTANKELAP
jgi:multicomponent Na+:H+ antiporter subunit G